MDVKKKNGYFYREIAELTSEIGKLGLSTMLIEAAVQQDADKVNEIVEQFKAEHPELWERMSNLYEMYDNQNYPNIFSGDASNNLYEYDAEKIDPINLICLNVLSDGIMDDSDLFLNYTEFYTVLRNSGYSKIADYLQDPEEVNFLRTVEDLLKAFK